MTSSSSLYGTVTTQNSSSSNSTSLYGEAATPIPDSSGNLVVRGDLYVLSGNILTTASTGNIFPTNATTVNLGLQATGVNIGADSGTTTINNNLVVDGTGTFAGDITATGADFGNIQIAVVDEQTISTTAGELRLTSNNGSVKLPSVTAIYTDNTSTFSLLNQPTTINAFLAATTLNIGANTGETNINNDLLVEGTGTFTGNVTAPGADIGDITIAVADEKTITTTSGELRLSSFSGDIKLSSIDSVYTDTTGTFNLLNQPTSVYAFRNATVLELGEDTGTTGINNDLRIDGTTVSLAPATTIAYSEANNRLNRPTVRSTNGNTSGFRVEGPNTGTGSIATITAANSSDQLNTKFININARGSAFASSDLRIQTGKYTAGVLGASGSVVSFIDNATVYATVNPAGPTDALDLTTKAYVDALPANITYTIDATNTTGGANFNLVGSDATTDTIKFANGTGVLIVRTDANTITANIGQSVATTASPTFAGLTAGNITVGVADDNAITTTAGSLVIGSFTDSIGLGSTDTLTTNSTSFNLLNSPLTVSAFQAATAVSLGALTGTTTVRNQLATTNFTFPLADGTSNQIIKTNGSGVLSWYSPSDLNTTYTIDASTTTGGANFNLAGSDASTDTIKIANGTNVTAVATDANTITINATDTNTTYTQDASSTTGGANLNLVGSDATTDTVKFAGGTNVTVVATDANTITINAPDTNTTYTIDASSTTGGANLNLVGSDASTDTVKFAEGTGIDIVQTDANTITVNSTITQYTDALARASLSGTAPIGYNTTTGAITFVPTPTTGSLLGGNGTTWVDSITGITGQYTLNRNATGATGSNNVLVLTKTRTDGARTNGQGPIEVFNYVGTDGGYNFARLQVGYQSGGAHSYNFQTSTDTTGAFGAGTSTPLTFSKSAATFTIEGGTLITNRTGSVAAQPPAQILRYLRTDQTGPQDGDGIDFRLGVGGTATNTNFARFDGQYKASGDNEIGMSVSADSFSADTDRIYVGSRANTQIRNTPVGGGTTNTTAEFTQLATTLKTDSVVLQTAAAAALPSGKISYGRQYINAYSTVTQTNPVANAENLMIFGTTDISNGISIVTNGTALTRITFANAGTYNLQFSAQLSQTAGGADNAYIWLKKNGANVTYTAGDTRVAGNGDRIMAAWNYVFSAAAGDYFELAWAASGTTVVLEAVAAAGVVPGIASVILTVTPVGA